MPIKRRKETVTSFTDLGIARLTDVAPETKIIYGALQGVRAIELPRRRLEGVKGWVFSSSDCCWILRYLEDSDSRRAHVV